MRENTSGGGSNSGAATGVERAAGRLDERVSEREWERETRERITRAAGLDAADHNEAAAAAGPDGHKELPVIKHGLRRGVGNSCCEADRSVESEQRTHAHTSSLTSHDRIARSGRGVHRSMLR